jgi:sugar phosphate isomerase/epimerase
MTESLPPRSTQRVFISMPFRRIDAHMLALVRERRLDLEVGIDHAALDACSREEFARVAGALRDAGLAMTVHAPFREIFPGAPDRLVREAACARLDAAFALAPLFAPASIVMHLNFEYRRFGVAHRDWLGRTADALDRYAELAGDMGALLCLENVYEESPAVFGEVFDLLAAPNVRHCVDVGHLAAFSKIGVREWLDATGPRVGQFHLHDNDGSGDEHRPIGSGTVDFRAVREFMAGMDRAPLVTLEPHTEPHILATLKGFREAGFPEVLAKLPRGR